MLTVKNEITHWLTPQGIKLRNINSAQDIPRKKRSDCLLVRLLKDTLLKASENHKLLAPPPPTPPKKKKGQWVLLQLFSQGKLSSHTIASDSGGLRGAAAWLLSHTATQYFTVYRKRIKIILKTLFCS